jgi:Tol biopolymer transport system component
VLSHPCRVKDISAAVDTRLVRPVYLLILVVAVAATSGGVAAGRSAVASADARIAFVRFMPRVGHPRVYTVDPDGSNVRRLRLPVAAAEAPAWSPDGRWLAFIGGRNRPNEQHVQVEDELYVARADGSRAKRLTADRAHESAPAWSPDGKRFVFVRSSGSGNRSSLWLIGANGRGLRRLTSGAIDIQPSWSRRREIAFVRIEPRSFQSAIWVVRPNRKGIRRLRTRLRNVTRPVWSPTGSRLLLTNGRRLMIVSGDGSKARIIANLAADARGSRVDPEPAWSPDGRRIVFKEPRRGTTGRADLWIVDADGSGRRRLTTSPGVDSDPHWRA